jgi:glycosyltransferase 2 family protein
MKKNLLSKLLQLVLFLGLGVFFIWISVKDLSPNDIRMLKESTKSALTLRPMLVILLSIIVMGLGHYCRGLRSVMLIKPMGYSIRKSTSFYAVMVGYLANLAFPRLGEVLRCTFLQRYDNVPFQKSLGTIVTERVIDMLIWIILMVITIALNSSVLSKIVVDQTTGETMGLWLTHKFLSMMYNYTLIILGIVVVVIGIILYLTRYHWMKNRFFAKIGNLIKGVWQGLISIKDLKNPYLFIFYTLCIWTAYFLGAYMMFFAFDFLNGLGFLPALSVLAIGSIGFMIAQGGLGAYPLLVAEIFVLYGVNYNQGLAAAWIGWSAQTVMVLVLGLASLILAAFLNKKNEIKPESI